MSEPTLQLVLALAFMVLALFVLPGALFIRLAAQIVDLGYKVLQQWLDNQSAQMHSLIDKAHNGSLSPPDTTPITPEQAQSTSTDGTEIQK